MFESCLICTDFNDGLQRSIDFVPDLAAAGLKQIIYFHSVPLWEEGEVPRIDTEKMELAEQRLSGALKNVPEGVDVQLEVVSGRPLDTIPRILEKYRIDLIIVGTPVRSLLTEKIFGSTTMGLAKLTSIPLLILRPELISTYTVAELKLRFQNLWNYILIPIDDSQECNYTITKIKEFAQSGGAAVNNFKQCLLLSIVDDTARDRVLVKQRIEKAEAKLTATKAELAELGLTVASEIREGNFLQEILDAAMNYDITAIAIASNYKTGLLKLVIPSDMETILRSSWFPVLFFSPKK